MQVIPELLDLAVRYYSNKIAVFYKEEYLTYFDLVQKIEGFSQFLLNSGLNYQDRVAIFLPNSPKFIISFFAIAKIGAIAVTFNINYKEEELRNYLKLCKIRYIISDKHNQDKCRSAIKQLSTKLIIIDSKDNLTLRPPNRLNGEINSKVNINDEVLRQFSSGSTGKPKLVSRNHFNILNEAKSIYATIGISSKDKILCIVPLSHAYGFGSAMMSSFYSGATLILTEKFNPHNILKILKEERVSIIFGVPCMFSMLADVLPNKRISLSSLRYCFSAGISLPTEVSKKFYYKFGVYVRDLYGTSETGCISINLNKNIENTLNSVGLPIKGTNIEIVLESGRKAKIGEEGEIAVKTPTCGRWYYISEIKKPLLKDGYFYTGDIGKKDKKGNLYILGRKTSFINVAGEKVDPKEVENTLKKYQGVKEVAVVGSPDNLRGEVVKAVIVSNRRIFDKKPILRYCRERMADFKIPRIIEFRDELPRSPLGKILKGYL